MTLDTSLVYNQIEAMAGELRTHQSDFLARLRQALSTLTSIEDQEKLAKKIEQSKATWLVAGLKEDITFRKAAPSCPGDFAVVASDGSHIDVDRHYSPRLFLLNIGLAYLQYGENPDADLSSTPSVYFGDEMQAITSPEGKQELIQGALLGIKRGVEEVRHLADRMCSGEGGLPCLGLVDGSLIMWGLVGQRYEDFVVKHLLDDGFLKELDRLHELAASKRVAVASYISFPRSNDVVNILRLHVCPHETVDCDKYCEGKFEGRPCDIVGGPLDRDLFDELLTNGQRSALFFSRSSIVQRYGIHRVCFFYVKLDEEVARVEVPLWVADSGELLDLVHALVIDQCEKGMGYPVSLSEAHELAVVTGADREAFWNLVDRTMQDAGMEVRSSLKQRSKKAKWI